MCGERLAQPSSWDLSGRSCSWKEGRKTGGSCQQHLSLVSVSASPRAACSPYGSIRKPQPTGSCQPPPTPCFLLPLPPRAYFRLTKLEDTSAIGKATPSVTVEDVRLGRQDGFCSQGCHLPRNTHSFKPSDLSFISSAVGFVYLFSPREVGNFFQACLCCGIKPGSTWRSVKLATSFPWRKPWNSEGKALQEHSTDS